MTRINKFKIEKKQGIKRKFVIGLVSLSTTFVLTTGVAFANSELDISTLLQNWYSKKANEAIVKMETAVQSEVEFQKIRLKEEVQLKLQSSAEEIDSFTKSQTGEIIKEIQNYADELIRNANFSNDSEKQQIAAQLSAIQNEAFQAINQIFSGRVNPPIEATPELDSSIIEPNEEPENNETEQDIVEPEDKTEETTKPGKETKPQKDNDKKPKKTTENEESPIEEV